MKTRRERPESSVRPQTSSCSRFSATTEREQKNPKLLNRHFYVHFNREAQREEEVEELPGGSASAGNLRCLTSSQSNHRTRRRCSDKKPLRSQICAKLVFHCGGNRQTANDTTSLRRSSHAAMFTSQYETDSSRSHKGHIFAASPHHTVST